MKFFEQEGESFLQNLEHVLELLESTNELADVELTDEQWLTVRKNGPIAALEPLLRNLLVGSGIEAWRVDDANEVMQFLWVADQLRITPFQRAWATALSTVLAARWPADLDELWRLRLRGDLLAIFALGRDARSLVAVSSEAIETGPADGIETPAARSLSPGPGRPLGSVGPVRELLREFVGQHPGATGKELWRLLEADVRVVRVSDTVLMHEGCPITWGSLATLLTRARNDIAAQN